MDSYLIPSALGALLSSFAGCFTAPGYRRFLALTAGWVLVVGRHTVSRVLRVLRVTGYPAHHSTLYRFLSVGRWSIDALGEVVFRQSLRWLETSVVAAVDDTLCHKCGTQIFGVGVHHDAARSSYNRRGKRITVFGFGHSWVVLSVCVPCPWNRMRGWALPVLFRLYRQRRRCPPAQYRTRTDLAAEMIRLLASWLPEDRRLVVTGDRVYMSKPVIRALPARTALVGPLPMNAALHELPQKSRGVGRPRRKGYRIASPETIAAYHTDWQEITVPLAQQEVDLKVWTQICQWYNPVGPKPVRAVVTRDPKNRMEARAYASTDPDLSASDLLTLVARRWQIEVTFRDLKQELGFEDPQNGWWRRPKGKRADTRSAMLRRAPRRGENAVRRTAPLAGLIYSIVALWFLRDGMRLFDLDRLRGYAPWYLAKTEPSFQDMLRALRASVITTALRRTRPADRIRKIEDFLLAPVGVAA